MQGQVGFAGLRMLATCGGCAAKADPGLVTLLTSLVAAATPNNPAVLAGLAPCDDAAVYQLDAERALVATVDFFPPLVDDPEDYGAIAAANAVSDVYAMGGEVAFALVLWRGLRTMARASSGVRIRMQAAEASWATSVPR